MTRIPEVTATVLTVNVGRLMPVEYTDAPSGGTGIDKRPADGPVRVVAPGPKGEADSGLIGDMVSDEPATTAETTKRCMSPHLSRASPSLPGWARSAGSPPRP